MLLMKHHTVKYWVKQYIFSLDFKYIYRYFSVLNEIRIFIFNDNVFLPYPPAWMYFFFLSTELICNALWLAFWWRIHAILTKRKILPQHENVFKVQPQAIQDSDELFLHQRDVKNLALHHLPTSGPLLCRQRMGAIRMRTKNSR